MTETMSKAWVAAPTPETTDADRAAIRAAVLDYFEGWFDADPGRVARALHPAVAKRSYGQDTDRTPALSSLTADQMVAWTAAGDGRALGRAARALDIQIAGASGTIATVIVRSDDYVEYLHLVDTSQGWRIVNALWRWADGHGPDAR